MEWISFRLLLRNAISVYNFKYKHFLKTVLLLILEYSIIFYNCTLLHIKICITSGKLKLNYTQQYCFPHNTVLIKMTSMAFFVY